MKIRRLKVLTFVAQALLFLIISSNTVLKACCWHPDDVKNEEPTETCVDLEKIVMPECKAFLEECPVSIIQNQLKQNILYTSYQTSYNNGKYTLEIELEPCNNNHTLIVRLLGHKHRLDQHPEQNSIFLMTNFIFAAQDTQKAIDLCLPAFLTNILLSNNFIDSSKQEIFDIEKIIIPQEKILGKHRIRLERYERQKNSLSAWYSLNIAQQVFKLFIDIQQQDGMLTVRLHGRQQKSFPPSRQSELSMLFRYRELVNDYQNTINFGLVTFFRNIYYQVFDQTNNEKSDT